MTQTIKGLRILNTRPTNQQDVLSDAIQSIGGISISFPALSIEPSTERWWTEIPSLTSVQQVIFVSANAVHYFFTRLYEQKEVLPKTIQTTAIGYATAKALSSWHKVDHIPPMANSESLLGLKNLLSIEKQTILLVKGEGGRMIIEQTLLARGATVIPLNVYRRALPNPSQEEITSLWQDDLVDIILFTSQQTMQNLFTLFDKTAHAWLLHKPCIVISERLAEEALRFGMQSIIVSSYDTILVTLEHYYRERTNRTISYWRPSSPKD